MIFTTGQWLGIAALTTVTIAVGVALLKLDALIGTNYEVEESDAPKVTVAHRVAPSCGPSTSRRQRQR